MTTLASAPVRPLLDRLFAEAEANHAWFREAREALHARGLKRGAPEFAEITRNAYMAVSPEIGRLLYLTARARGARVIVEFGTSFGISAIHLAAALRDNGGGTLVTTEAQPHKAAAARATLTEAGLADCVEIREGDAMKTLADGLPGPVDMLFLDGAGHLYLDVLALVEPALAPAAVIVADNADEPGYRDYVRGQQRFVSAPAGERVEVTLLAG